MLSEFRASVLQRSKCHLGEEGNEFDLGVFLFHQWENVRHESLVDFIRRCGRHPAPVADHIGQNFHQRGSLATSTGFQVIPERNTDEFDWP